VIELLLPEAPPAAVSNVVELRLILVAAPLVLIVIVSVSPAVTKIALE
jgi:hypothetical protein